MMFLKIIFVFKNVLKAKKSIYFLVSEKNIVFWIISNNMYLQILIDNNKFNNSFCELVKQNCYYLTVFDKE